MVIGGLAIARGYPKVRVDGIDTDAASIKAAKEHLAADGVGERVQFHLRDAADEQLAGNYDLVYIHEALHDMWRERCESNEASRARRVG